ncbi:MAG: hypothetical protein FXF54_08520 [Kosmotoga sp.]|nr:MAG: hypothetical protein FXF54_08520 [Kosmotoga sp.]
MASTVNIIDVLNILGNLEDETKNSTRERFYKNYLAKINEPSIILEESQEVYSAYWSAKTNKEMYQNAYGDLVNRLGEITGYNVEYAKYGNRERITGVWKLGSENILNIAAFIPEDVNNLKWVSRHALLVLPEEINLDRPFVTLPKLVDFFNMILQINLPLGSVTNVLSIDNNFDKKLVPTMELVFLAFKKELSSDTPKYSMSAEWSKEELAKLLKSIKEPTREFIKSLVEKPKTAKELYKEMNSRLPEENSLKSPMAIGAIMGALSKHYGGIKEKIVEREGNSYKLVEKYKNALSDLINQ